MSPLGEPSDVAIKRAIWCRH